MARKGHSQEKIIYALKQAEAGVKTAEICREHGISEQTFYNWKRKYGGMGVSELRRLKVLEEENRKLKALVADLTLDKHILQEVIKKKIKGREVRDLAKQVQGAYEVTIQRSCQLLLLQRSVYYYRSRARDRSALSMRIKELATTRIRYGYLRITVLLQREGWPVGKKLVHRLYRQMGLQVRTKRRKKLASRKREGLLGPSTRANQYWSVDFMSERLEDGCPLRVLTQVDQWNRLSHCVVAAKSFSGRRVSQELDRAAKEVGYPEVIRCDNGPEFCSRAFDQWAHLHRIRIDYSRPGKPVENSDIVGSPSGIGPGPGMNGWMLKDNRGSGKRSIIVIGGHGMPFMLAKVSPGDFEVDEEFVIPTAEMQQQLAAQRAAAEEANRRANEENIRRDQETFRELRESAQAAILAHEKEVQEQAVKAGEAARADAKWESPEAMKMAARAKEGRELEARGLLEAEKNAARWNAHP